MCAYVNTSEERHEQLKCLCSLAQPTWSGVVSNRGPAATQSSTSRTRPVALVGKLSRKHVSLSPQKRRVWGCVDLSTSPPWRRRLSPQKRGEARLGYLRYRGLARDSLSLCPHYPTNPPGTSNCFCRIGVVGMWDDGYLDVSHLVQFHHVFERFQNPLNQ